MIIRSRRFGLCLALATVSSAAASFAYAQATAPALVGRAHAADGDSLVLEGRRVRLFGIDAPELSQSCTRSGQTWACGDEAKQKLEGLVSGREVYCKPISIDAFDRQLATCSAGGLDINDAMVRSGYATAYRHYSAAYVSAEEQARGARLGIWAGDFEEPAEYRHAGQETKRTVIQIRTRVISPRGASACLIKGNHSRRGEWIYHVPGMPYYEGTRAEAMFCTEAQAQAAGYRRSRADLHR